MHLAFQVTKRSDTVPCYDTSIIRQNKDFLALKEKKNSGSMLQRESSSPPSTVGVIYTACRVQISVQASVDQSVTQSESLMLGHWGRDCCYMTLT